MVGKGATIVLTTLTKPYKTSTGTEEIAMIHIRMMMSQKFGPELGEESALQQVLILSGRDDDLL